MAKQSISVMLSTLAISFLVSSAYSPECQAHEAQGAVCGSAKAEFFQTRDRDDVTIDRKGTMWAGTNQKVGEKCGLIFDLGDDKHILKSNERSEVMFDSLTDAAKSKIMLTFVFKPQLGLPDLITITKPLTFFDTGEWLGHPMAYVKSQDLFKEAGVPDLKKLTITNTGTERVVVRHIRIESERGSTSNFGIKLTNLDCSALPTFEEK